MKHLKILPALCFFILLLGEVKGQQQAVTTIPFEVVHGSIVLKVNINDHPRPLRLLFDTGADGMAVDRSLADSIGLKVTKSHEASVVGGSMKIDVSHGNTVTLENGFQLKNQGIAIFPQMSKDLDGIIGNSMTLRYVVKVDFNRYQLSLYEFEGYSYEKGGTVVPVTIPQGLFIIPAHVEVVAGKSYAGNFVFDTGAAYNAICFRPFVRQHKLLVSGFVPEYQASTTSMGISSPTFNGKAHSFSFSNTPAIGNMPVTLMAGGGQNESWNPGFDGSIGMGIISRYNFTINRKKNEIYIVPNHAYAYPLNFVLGAYLLCFNLQGQLEVQSTIRALADGEMALPNGTLISSINGMTARSLLKEAKMLESLKNLPAQTSIRVEYLNDSKKETITFKK